MYRDAPGGPIAYLINISSASNLLRSSFYVLQTLLGDFCLVRKYYCYSHSLLRCTWLHDTFSQIYRCSVVWQHNIWIIILPILLWISCAGKWAILWILNKGLFLNLVAGVGAIISFSKVSPEAQLLSLARWVAAFYATTLAANAMCTCTSSFWDPSPLLTSRIQLW